MLWITARRHFPFVILGVLLLCGLPQAAQAVVDDWIVIIDHLQPGQSAAGLWQQHNMATPRAEMRGAGSRVVGSEQVFTAVAVSLEKRLIRGGRAVVWVYAPLIETAIVPFRPSMGVIASVIERVPAPQSNIMVRTAGGVPTPAGAIGILVEVTPAFPFRWDVTEELIGAAGIPVSDPALVVADFPGRRLDIHFHAVCDPPAKLQSAQLMKNSLKPGEQTTLQLVLDGRPRCPTQGIRFGITASPVTICFDYRINPGDEWRPLSNLVLGEWRHDSPHAHQIEIRARDACELFSAEGPGPDFQLAVCVRDVANKFYGRECLSNSFSPDADVLLPLRWDGVVARRARPEISSVTFPTPAVPSGAVGHVRIELRDFPNVQHPLEFYGTEEAWPFFLLEFEPSFADSDAAIGFFRPVVGGGTTDQFPTGVRVPLEDFSSVVWIDGQQFPWSVQRTGNNDFVVLFPFKARAVPIDTTVQVAVTASRILGFHQGTSQPISTRTASVQVQFVGVQPPVPSVPQIKEGESLSLTIALNRPAGGRTIVTLGSSDKGALDIPDQLIFERGEQTKVIQIVAGRLPLRASMPVTISARLPDGNQLQTTEVEVQPAMDPLR